MNPRHERLLRLFERFYGRILAVYPEEFRDEYRAEMAVFFREECRQTVRRGGLPGLLVQSFRILVDLVSTAPGVHMEVLRQDLRFGFRMLRNSPAFALTAILSLAIGIGANSTIFSLVHGNLLMPLPYPDPDRLVMVWDRNPKGIERNSVSPPNFTDYRTNAKSFSGMAAFYENSVNLSGQAEPEHVSGSMVTPEFFEVLGIQPEVGTRLRSETGVADVVLSYSLWQRRFNGDPAVAGKNLSIDDRSYTIRGVMPEGFHFPSRDIAVWTTMPADYLHSSRQAHFLRTVARVRPGISLSQARAELDAIAAGLARQFPASNTGWGVTVLSLKEQIVGGVRTSLLVLLGAVGLVLLIACANIANLLLARSTHRQGEIAVRTALGASTVRLSRQLLTESTLLALLGGAVGLALSLGSLEALRAFDRTAIPRLDEVGINGWVIAFTFTISLLTGVVSGIAPALRVSRADLHDAMKDGIASRKRFVGRKLSSILIEFEVALSLLLLVGAGLLIRGFVHLQRLDPGFNPERVITLQIDMLVSRYANPRLRAALLQEAVSRVHALPGVGSAGVISTLPLTGGEGYNRFGFSVEGIENPATTESHRFYARWVSPGYFGGMGIPLLRGRDFQERDREGSSPSVIIDAALARRYFPNENPIGRYLRVSYAKSVPREIVGVVGEVRLVSLEMEPAPQIYIPVLQETQLSTVSLAVRSSINGPATAEAIRQELYRIDKNLPVYDVQLMTHRVAESIAPRRLNMFLMSVLASLALVLAAVGIYGVISYMVGERLREIGIRMALGAPRTEILLMIIRQGMTHALIGIATGLIAAVFLAKSVSPVDGWTLGAVALLTAMVALAACFIPALRASRVDPIQAVKT